VHANVLDHRVSSWHQYGVVNFIAAGEDSIEVTASPGLLIPVIILTEMPIVQVDEMSKGSFGHHNPSTINGTCSSTCGLIDSIMCETRARNKRPKRCVCVWHEWQMWTWFHNVLENLAWLSRLVFIGFVLWTGGGLKQCVHILQASQHTLLNLHHQIRSRLEIIELSVKSGKDSTSTLS
jgi:hypothetical protein